MKITDFQWLFWEFYQSSHRKRKASYDSFNTFRMRYSWLSWQYFVVRRILQNLTRFNYELHELLMVSWASQHYVRGFIKCYSFFINFIIYHLYRYHYHTNTSDAIRGIKNLAPWLWTYLDYFIAKSDEVEGFRPKFSDFHGSRQVLEGSSSLMMLSGSYIKA